MVSNFKTYSFTLFIVSAVDSISFIIVPVTQYVYANDNVTFECGINVTQPIPSFVTTPSVDGSVLSSGGMASLTLTATSEVNGTEVTCRVPDEATTTEPAYLYVQGPPDSVSNLTGYQLDSCCMFISWYPPFTLPGLTVQYIISVGTDQQYLNDSITNYTYCPMNPTNKQYLFNITTTNKAGNGSTSNITVGFQSTNVQLYVTDKERENVNWTFHFIVSVHQSCTNVLPLMNITLKGCTKDNCYLTTNVSISNSSYNNISLVVQFPSNKTLNTNATLYYQNGVTVQSNTITISTHDLQEFTLINITSNSVCLQFQYVSGSTPYIDVILLADDVGYITSFNISPNDQLNFTQCITNIPAGNNLTLYACEWATFWICTSNPPAVITGINITNDFTSSVLMSSVHSSSVSLTSTVLTTPSMMSVPSTSPVITTLSVSTTSSSTSITSSMTFLPTMVSTLFLPTPSIASEFRTFPSSVSTTSTVQHITSSTIINNITDTPTINSPTFINTTRLTSTLVTGTSTASSSFVIAHSSLTSSSIALSSLSSLLSSSPSPSLTAPSSISSSSSIIGLASGISIALLIIIIGMYIIIKCCH
uniref:Fibronectin type-III domain-containing protein n=1 Tax=Amphimedon queenslandica TaxID=400682 RepID=A0A1X7T0G2_AMPQE